MDNKNKVFSDVREAFGYLVNELWENLSPEERVELRIHKSNFNHASISVDKMEEVLAKFGTVEKKIVLPKID
jgi:hypothetical protein